MLQVRARIRLNHLLIRVVRRPHVNPFVRVFANPHPAKPGPVEREAAERPELEARRGLLHIITTSSAS